MKKFFDKISKFLDWLVLPEPDDNIILRKDDFLKIIYMIDILAAMKSEKKRKEYLCLIKIILYSSVVEK